VSVRVVRDVDCPRCGWPHPPVSDVGRVSPGVCLTCRGRGTVTETVTCRSCRHFHQAEGCRTGQCDRFTNARVSFSEDYGCTAWEPRS